MVRLPLGCPPQLAELAGYTGAGRIAALWWTALGDELMFSDGTITGPGDQRGWLCFCGHPLGRLLLDPHEFGSSAQGAEHWLLVDRQLGTLDVGLVHDVRGDSRPSCQSFRRSSTNSRSTTPQRCSGACSRIVLRVEGRRRPRRSATTSGRDSSATRSSSEPSGDPR
jgi:hypothetical protein